MRSLASVVKIDDTYPVPESDNLSVAQVGGWKIVTRRDEYKPGDMAIYFEVDSFLPEIEEFEFLRKNSYKFYNGKPGFRLKTIKLRGQVSQGLLVNLSLLNKFGHLEGEYFTTTTEGNELTRFTLNEGFDLTDILGVVKYDVEIASNSGGGSTPSGTFPSFIVKTDETRIQDPRMIRNVMKYVDKNPNDMWYATSKLDGSSITVYKKDDHIGVCSRNNELKETEHDQFWVGARKAGLLDFVTNYPGNIALQGELVGPGIQKNRLKLEEKDVYVFSMFNIDTFEYATGFELIAAAKENGFKLVPVLYTGMIPTTKKEILAFAEKIADQDSPLVNEPQEGAVFRPLSDKNISFKFISSTYLLKHGL